LELRRTFRGGVDGLPLEGLRQHPLGENFLNGDEEVFHLGELGAPGRPAKSPDAVDQVFGDAVEVGTHFVDSGGRFLGECHPWHLIGVGAIPE